MKDFEDLSDFRIFPFPVFHLPGEMALGESFRRLVSFTPFVPLDQINGRRTLLPNALYTTGVPTCLQKQKHFHLNNKAVVGSGGGRSNLCEGRKLERRQALTTGLENDTDQSAAKTGAGPGRGLLCFVTAPSCGTRSCHHGSCVQLSYASPAP